MFWLLLASVLAAASSSASSICKKVSESDGSSQNSAAVDACLLKAYSYERDASQQRHGRDVPVWPVDAQSDQARMLGISQGNVTVPLGLGPRPPSVSCTWRPMAVEIMWLQDTSAAYRAFGAQDDLPVALNRLQRILETHAANYRIGLSTFADKPYAEARAFSARNDSVCYTRKTPLTDDIRAFADAFGRGAPADDDDDDAPQDSLSAMYHAATSPSSGWTAASKNDTVRLVVLVTNRIGKLRGVEGSNTFLTDEFRGVDPARSCFTEKFPTLYHLRSGLRRYNITPVVLLGTRHRWTVDYWDRVIQAIGRGRRGGSMSLVGAVDAVATVSAFERALRAAICAADASKQRWRRGTRAETAAGAAATFAGAGARKPQTAKLRQTQDVVDGGGQVGTRGRTKVMLPNPEGHPPVGVGALSASSRDPTEDLTARHLSGTDTLTDKISGLPTSSSSSDPFIPADVPPRSPLPDDVLAVQPRRSLAAASADRSAGTPAGPLASASREATKPNVTNHSVSSALLRAAIAEVRRRESNAGPTSATAKTPGASGATNTTGVRGLQERSDTPVSVDDEPPVGYEEWLEPVLEAVPSSKDYYHSTEDNADVPLEEVTGYLKYTTTTSSTTMGPRRGSTTTPAPTTTTLPPTTTTLPPTTTTPPAAKPVIPTGGGAGKDPAPAPSDTAKAPTFPAMTQKQADSRMTTTTTSTTTATTTAPRTTTTTTTSEAAGATGPSVAAIAGISTAGAVGVGSVVAGALRYFGSGTSTAAAGADQNELATAQPEEAETRDQVARANSDIFI